METEIRPNSSSPAEGSGLKRPVGLRIEPGIAEAQSKGTPPHLPTKEPGNFPFFSSFLLFLSKILRRAEAKSTVSSRGKPVFLS